MIRLSPSRLRQIMAVAAMGVMALGLGGCDRTPPTSDEMKNALQAAFDEEAASGGSNWAKTLKIAKFETQNCSFTAMVGKPIYQCDVVIALGSPEKPGPDFKPRPVMFHKTEKGWIVPP